MIRPIQTTLIMGLIAAATSVAAAIYFPWPVFERVSDRVNKPLYAGLDAKQVRTVEIARFDPDRKIVERLVLERRGEKWILPSHAGFTASNALRIAAVINNFVECKVLELETDSQLDHLKFGVMDVDDPESLRNPAGGLGWKVTLRDRSQTVLASALVGQPVAGAEGRQKRFVRIPGEPQVYVVDFEAAALSTRFRDWVDANLLQLQWGGGSGELLLSSLIDSFRIDPENLASGGQRQLFYRAELGVRNGQPAVLSLQVPEDGQWTSREPSQQQSQVLLRATSLLQSLVFLDAQPKDAKLAGALARPTEPANEEVFESAVRRGFRPVIAEGQPVRFESTGGVISVRLASGIQVMIYLGNIVAAPGSETRLARLAMLVAEFDESQFPEPATPVNDDGSPLTEEQLRVAADERKKWSENVQKAQQRAVDFNATHAPWYYALDEELVNLIRPELPSGN